MPVSCSVHLIDYCSELQGPWRICTGDETCVKVSSCVVLYYPDCHDCVRRLTGYFPKLCILILFIFCLLPSVDFYLTTYCTAPLNYGWGLYRNFDDMI